MLLISYISAYARCLAGKVCGLVQSTWGTSLGENKIGARDKILNTKVVRRACAGRAPCKHSPIALQKSRWVVSEGFLFGGFRALCVCVQCPHSAHAIPFGKIEQHLKSAWEIYWVWFG